ncbi:MAG: hypothetical protein WA192_10405 [Candidatus Acidiferrales bacterium]
MQAFFQTLLLVLAVTCTFGCGNVSAKFQPAPDPPQGTQQTQAGQVSQIFTLTTSTAATYSNSSGALEPMPSTSVTFETQAASLVTISFSARGSVEPSSSQTVPIVFIECHIDGQPCQPDTNTVEFLYPQFCCDTRSFHWVAQSVSAGTHVVEILWGMGNPTAAVVTNRALIVEAAAAAN